MAGVEDVVDSTQLTKEGKLHKKGKYSSKWHSCSVKLEKECFVYKKTNKVAIFHHLDNL